MKRKLWVLVAVLAMMVMTVGTASGIQAAIRDASQIEDVAYVCRHRYWSSRRACWWRPGPCRAPRRR